MCPFHQVIQTCIVLLLLCTKDAKGGLSLSNPIDINSCRRYEDYHIRYFSENCFVNPNVFGTTASLIQWNNYDFERHTLGTDDGYILEIFRIPPRTKKRSNQPVFLMNGIVTSNKVWVDNGNQSLAFFLADEGFDVWLGTFRGTSDTRFRESRRMYDEGYWDFDLDTLVQYDVRKQLQWIYNKTGTSLVYIGFSMGTTLGFMYTSAFEKESHQILKGIVALAPVAYLNNVPLIRAILPFISIIQEVLPVVMGHTAGVSVPVLLQFAQIAETGNFSRRSYGKEANRRLYNSDDPPLYRLENVKLPVLLLHGSIDLFASTMNVEKLYQELGSERKFLVQIPKDRSEGGYTHLDFIISKDGRELLFPEILDFIDSQLL